MISPACGLESEKNYANVTSSTHTNFSQYIVSSNSLRFQNSFNIDHIMLGYLLYYMNVWKKM
jgi:hypothetical protein